MKKPFILLGLLLVQSIAMAQTGSQKPVDLNYSYAELRYIDVDVRGGDGFRINVSYALDGNWIIVGGLTRLDFNNNTDLTTVELGGGYVWHFKEDFDLVSTVRFVRSDVDAFGVGADDNGVALASGIRGLLTPKFEIRGSVNYIDLDDSDIFLEIAGDYYFSKQLAAGISLEFAGDTDAFTIGARWFF